jgi:prevent-host-death family protein
MRKVATVSALRAELARYLKRLEEGPVTVLSHGKPVAILIEPEIYYALVDKCEMLENLQEGLLALLQSVADRDVSVDTRMVLERVGR